MTSNRAPIKITSMAPRDPVDEADEETFRASDAPTFSTAHAGSPADHLVRVLVDLPPEAADAGYFRRALARFDGRVALTFADAAGDDFARALPDADVVIAQGLSDEEVARASRLRWLSSVAAGLDAVATPALLARGVAVTSASGVHGPNIAEHVMAMILMFTRGMPRLYRAQLARRWERKLTSRSDGPGELTGKTLLIVGLGRIGEAIAARARPFGVRLIAVKHDPSTRYDAGVVVDELVGMDALDDVLGRADHVCLAVPLTGATHRLIDARRIARLRPGAFIYNVSRGAVIDEAALVEALRAGKLAGAGLDVFEEEPLPPTSPLWDLDNVILTPHIAGATPLYYERTARLFSENVGRLLAGQPLR
ncbi:MAG TPA: D-2-hydroxyacid dehydrogenase, partial [Polyangia bacterium]|nr:D-2-hydroxyacid dehydrogenase [Polyangia bacterium]